MNITRIAKITAITAALAGSIAAGPAASAAPVRRCAPVTVPDGADVTPHRSILGRWTIDGHQIGWAAQEDGTVYTTAPCAVRSALVCWKNGPTVVGSWRGYGVKITGPVVVCPAGIVNRIAAGLSAPRGANVPNIR